MSVFKIHIGDWSADGHGMQEVFCVQSESDVEAFRDAYVDFNSKYPNLNLEKICSDYEDSVISQFQADEFVKLGFSFDEEQIHEGDVHAYPSTLAHLMMWACKHIDNTLEYAFVNETVPTFHNYGYDKKGRHIHGPGYGCFSL